MQALFGVSVETARIDHLQLLAAVHADDRSRVMACIEAAALVRGPIDDYVPHPVGAGLALGPLTGTTAAVR